jgi:hypothetical protein
LCGSRLSFVVIINNTILHRPPMRVNGCPAARIKGKRRFLPRNKSVSVVFKLTRSNNFKRMNKIGGIVQEWGISTESRIDGLCKTQGMQTLWWGSSELRRPRKVDSLAHSGLAAILDFGGTTILSPAKSQPMRNWAKESSE